MNVRSLIEKGFFHLLSVNFLNQFLGFGSILLVAKFLTPVELGEIKIVQSYAALFTVLAGFGLSTAVLKFCAENRTAEDRAGILRYALGRSALTTALTLLLLTVLVLTGVITPERRLALWLLVYALGVIPLAVLTDIYTVFLQALKKIKEMARAQALIKGETFLLIVISTWRWGFRGFIFSTIGAYGAGLLLLLWQVKVRLRAAAPASPPLYFSQIALFSVLANGLYMLGQYADIFILDHFLKDRAEIGYYSLATIFLLAATQVTATVQSITTPYFSERANDEHWFRRQLVKNQGRMAVLSIAVALAIYGMAWLLIPIVYGPAYQSSLLYLSILLLKYIIFSSYAVIGVALLGLGLVRYNFIVVSVATPVGIILSYVLLQRLGISGVAWAQVCAAVVSLLVALWLGARALHKTFAPAPENTAQPGAEKRSET